MTLAARRRPARPRPERRMAERRGRLAELLCRWHLRLRGWRIVASHWRCPSGEIDILARRGRVLAIIEVKARRDFATAAEIGAAAPAAAHCPGRFGLFDNAARSRPADPPIRRNAGRAAAAAAPFARRMAQRRLTRAFATAGRQWKRGNAKPLRGAADLADPRRPTTDIAWTARPRRKLPRLRLLRPPVKIPQCAWTLPWGGTWRGSIRCYVWFVSWRCRRCWAVVPGR